MGGIQWLRHTWGRGDALRWFFGGAVCSGARGGRGVSEWCVVRSAWVRECVAVWLVESGRCFGANLKGNFVMAVGERLGRVKLCVCVSMVA